MVVQTKSSLEVISKDGTHIGYRQYGQGEGLVLIQGTMGVAHHFDHLARALSDTFTVYIPDRRGRGMSKHEAETVYSTQKEVEGLDALLQQTGARAVFGLSSGAIIALESARQLTAIHRLAIYEPPFFVDGLPVELMERYEREIAQGKTVPALISAMFAAEMGPSFLRKLPRWLVEGFAAMGMRQEDRQGAGEYETMRNLAPTLRHDFTIVRENHGDLERFRDLHTPTLLLSGSKSQTYLQNATARLASILPDAKFIELNGLDHSAAWNRDKGGKPEIVAVHLREFFAE